MTTNDSSTPKKAENAQVQAVGKEFTLSGGQQNLDPAALCSRSPLELLLEGWETRARQLNEISRTEEDAPRSWYYGGRAAELTDCIAALRAQAEAGAAVDRGTHADWVMLAWLGHVDRERVLYKHGSSDPYGLTRTLRLPAFDIEEAQLRAFRTELTALGRGWVGDWRQIVLTPAGRQRLGGLRADFAAALAQADAGGEG